MANKTLVLDLLEWIGDGARPYGDVMDAWRTSCPRLPIWEDAVDHGFVVGERAAGCAQMSVRTTVAGRAFLARERA